MSIRTGQLCPDYGNDPLHPGGEILAPVANQMILPEKPGIFQANLPQRTPGQGSGCQGAGENGDAQSRLRTSSEGLGADALQKRFNGEVGGLHHGVETGAGAAAGFPQQQGLVYQFC